VPAGQLGRAPPRASWWGWTGGAAPAGPVDRRMSQADKGRKE
jgi:hypothetical protein